MIRSALTPPSLAARRFQREHSTNDNDENMLVIRGDKRTADTEFNRYAPRVKVPS
jgi:hypothetical protein